MGIFGSVADRWDPDNDYVLQPNKWVVDNAGEFAWSQQRNIMQSLVDNRYTAVHSAHDLGKSFIASRICGWWISSHPPGEAFVVTTAPTAAQVSAILWREIAKLHRKADLDGKINRAGYPQWYINNNQLVGYGRKPADYEESAFQGIHEKYVLVVMDEAGGIASHLYDAVDALATNEFARVLAIGNPDDPGSHFNAICKPNSGWNVIHMDGLRSPNMSKTMVIGHKSAGWGYENPKYPLLWALMRAEGIPFSTEAIPEEVRPMLVSPLWIEERIERWAGIPRAQATAMPPAALEDLVARRCAASPIFQSKVRGVFPTSGTNGVIPLGWVQLAVNRWHDLVDGYNGRIETPSLAARDPGRKVVGIDVAREGEDETVFATRYGSFVEKLEHFRIGDTTEVADNAASRLQEPGSIGVVDVLNMGAGVFDMLRRFKREGVIMGTPVPFNASERSDRVDHIGEFSFRNDRAAAWWNLRELLDPSKGSKIALPDDERLIEELVAVKYEYLTGGQIKIESKDDIRKRLGRSTDSADAVIQCFWVGGSAEKINAVAWGNPERGVEAPVVRWGGYDPFTDADLGNDLGFGSGSDLFGDENSLGHYRG